MLKIYLKGFDRPYAVFGRKLFEDERFFVVQSEGTERRILWENILYIESIIEREEQQVFPQSEPEIHPESPSADFIAKKLLEATEQARAKVGDIAPEMAKNVIVNLVGYKEQSFAMTLPGSVMGTEWTGRLSKEVFANPQMKAASGDFLISGQPTIVGNNITIQTIPTQKMEDVKSKLDATKALLGGLMGGSGSGKFIKPSINLDTSFSMAGSPFSTTVKLQDIE